MTAVSLKRPVNARSGSCSSSQRMSMSILGGRHPPRAGQHTASAHGASSSRREGRPESRDLSGPKSEEHVVLWACRERGCWLLGRRRITEVRKGTWAEFEGRVSQEERRGVSALFSMEGEALRNVVCEEG